MTSSKIATAGSSLSKVVTIASLGRNVLQQNSEDNGIQRNLKATENSNKLPRHNDWNDWWHPKGSAAQERKNGLSFTMEGAQGEPPHIKEEYRNLNNQQGINLDGFSTVMGVATKAPFSLRPDADDFKDPWTWGNWGGDASVKAMEAKEALTKPVKYQSQPAANAEPVNPKPTTRFEQKEWRGKTADGKQDSMSTWLQEGPVQK